MNQDEFDLDFSDFLTDNPSWQEASSVYIKREIINCETVWSVYSEDGLKMGSAPNREVACSMFQQASMTIHSVH